jgi:hypothetical protein
MIFTAYYELLVLPQKRLQLAEVAGYAMRS